MTHAGDLVPIKNKKTAKIDKQSFYSQLLAIAAIKGYREGWVSHKYREYFGVWPRGLKDVAIEPTDEVKNFLKYLQIKHAKSSGVQHANI